MTAVLLQREMNKTFDSALQETAQRPLPLAVSDIVGREHDGVAERLAAIRAREEFFTYEAFFTYDVRDGALVPASGMGSDGKGRPSGAPARGTVCGIG